MFKIYVRLLATFVMMVILSAGASAQTKYVFAHYLVTNQDYGSSISNNPVDGYMQEIQQAQAAGFNGFALDCGGWTNQTYYITYAERIFQAALNLNSGFKLFMSADMCCGNGRNDVDDMVRRFANDPNYKNAYFFYNGKAVLSTFSGDSLGTGFWQTVRNDLATGANPVPAPSGFPASSNADLPIVFCPGGFFSTMGGEIPSLSAVQSGWNEWSSTVDGMLYWGIAGVPGSGGSLDQVPSVNDYASVVQTTGGKLFMAPACFQFWGANADRYFEYSGYKGLRAMWMDIINTSHPTWVEDITWNDFIEGSYVSPIDDPNKYTDANYLSESGLPTWPSQPPLGYFHSHYGATALSSFFIQWYKNGSEPAITNDTIYWAYRTQSMNYNAGTPAVSSSTNYGPMADDIYVTCNLTAAATLEVTEGSNTTDVSVAAGSNDYAVLFTTGYTPSFKLVRNGTVLISASGTDQIQSSPQYNDYYYSTGDASDSGGGSGSGTIANGSWYLEPACATGSRLDDTNGATTNGNKLQIWQDADNGNQKWNFANVGGNSWNVAVLGPYCLYAGGTTSGSAAEIWSCNGSNAENMVSAAVSGGYNFAEYGYALCLDVSGAGNANGTAVQFYTCNGTNAQDWALVTN